MSQQPPRSVALHIGAHKTATTHLQRSIVMQKEALIKAGLRFYGPESLRGPKKGLADIFGLETFKRPTHPTRSREEQREFMFKDGHRLILSDENFIGVLHNKRGNMLAPLYPMADERVQDLAEAIGVGPVDVMIGLRSPATFLTSAYGQLLMGGQLNSFDDYIAKNPLSQVYWPGLVARLRQCAGVGRIVVWQFEEYRWRFHKICAAMMGDHVDMRIKPFPDKVHLGLSAAAVEHIMAHLEGIEASRLVDQARTAYPVSELNPPFAPFDAAEIAAATVDYDQQIADIADIEGVTVLRP